MTPTRNLHGIPQHSAPAIQWTVLDTDGNVVNLTGKLVRLKVYTRTTTAVTDLFDHDTADGSVVISGGNVVTATLTTTDTATARSALYQLWNVTDNRALVSGVFEVLQGTTPTAV